MAASRYNQTSTKDDGITFPRLESWNGDAKCATIAAQVNRQRVLCRISHKTLQEKFGASDEDPMKFLARHRSVIERAIRLLIENNDYEEDGSILIRMRDLTLLE